MYSIAIEQPKNLQNLKTVSVIDKDQEVDVRGEGGDGSASALKADVVDGGEEARVMSIITSVNNTSIDLTNRYSTNIYHKLGNCIKDCFLKKHILNMSDNNQQ